MGKSTADTDFEAVFAKHVELTSNKPEKITSLRLTNSKCQ